MIIELDIEWNVFFLTWGRGILKVAGIPVWYQGEQEPIEWSWIELLEFLSINWIHLKTEESYPVNLNPKEPRNLRLELKKKWERENITEFQKDKEDESVFRFEERHDLSRGMRGINLPYVIVMRQGNDALVCTKLSLHLVTLKEVLISLQKIGDCIASHIMNEGQFNYHIRRLIEVWNESLELV